MLQDYLRDKLAQIKDEEFILSKKDDKWINFNWITLFAGLFTAMGFAMYLPTAPFGVALTTVLTPLTVFYQTWKTTRLSKQTNQRLKNEKMHIQELFQQVPELSKEDHKNRRNIYKDCLQERRHQLYEENSCRKTSYILGGITLASALLSYFMPPLLGLTTGCGFTMILMGEKEAKAHKQVQNLEYQMNTITTDMRAIEEAKTEQQMRFQNQKSRQQRSYQNSYQKQRGEEVPGRAASITENEKLVDDYLDYLEKHPEDDVQHQKVS